MKTFTGQIKKLFTSEEKYKLYYYIQSGSLKIKDGEFQADNSCGNVLLHLLKKQKIIFDNGIIPLRYAPHKNGEWVNKSNPDSPRMTEIKTTNLHEVDIVRCQSSLNASYKRVGLS